MTQSEKLFTRVVLSSLLVSAVIAPVPSSAEEQKSIFKDVSPDAYYYEAIQSLLQRGIVQGFPDGFYRPSNEVTRGQAAKIIAGILELETNTVNVLSFKDVDKKNEYYGSIAALVEAGIISGYEDQTYRPNAPVTRAQMAKMIHLAFDLKDRDTTEFPFLDVEDSHWFKHYVESLWAYQITEGTTATAFSPNESVTRAQLAAFVIRAEQVVGKQNLTMTTIAGNGDFAYNDGQKMTAAFRSPTGIIALSNQKIFITDQQNHLVRELNHEEVQTYSGMTFQQDDFGLPQGGYYDGDQAIAMYHNPAGITADEIGNLYIADSSNHLIRKIQSNGEVSTVAGDGFVGDMDGQGTQAMFYSPQAIVSTKDGTLYVADTLNHTIRKITKEGMVSTLNAPSTRVVEVAEGVVELAGDFQDGAIQEAKFNEPSGLALDEAGNLYVSDSGNQLIRYIDFLTNMVTTVAGQKPNLTNTILYGKGGSTDGEALQAAFNFPKGLAMSNDGGVIIADSLNHTIRYLRNGKVWTIAAGLNHPTDVAVDEEDVIYLTDRDNQLIRQLK